MIEWLKTSIPGIILLGAVGSILAVALLRLGTTLLVRWFYPTQKAVELNR